MATIDNGGFETPRETRPGVPDAWLLFAGGATNYATFGLVDLDDPRESFESGWGNDAYGATPGETVRLVFASGFTRESFEEGWDNDAYGDELLSGTGAPFGTEGFETGWDNDVYGDAPALLDESPEEGFETGWGNDVYGDASEASQPASFGFASPATRESFEAVSAPTAVTVVPSTDRLFTALAHGLAVGAVVIFANEGGRLPEGIAADSRYYVSATPAADQFQISPTSGGAALDIQDFGVGTHTYTRDPRDFWIAA